jgi:hypothetical protein
MMKDDEESGLVRDRPDETLAIANRLKRGILCILCTILTIIVLLIIPLLVSLQGTITVVYQPQMEIYTKYLKLHTSDVAVCDLSVQPFIHPPDKKPGSVLLGVGGLTDLTNALQESTRIRIIDATCPLSYYETPNCMQPSWFKHGLLVKMSTVDQLVKAFPGFSPERIIVVVKNPFVEFAEEVRDGKRAPNLDQMKTFFALWASEQNAYQGLGDKIVLSLNSSDTSIKTIEQIRKVVPEDLVTESILQACYERKVKAPKPAFLSFQISKEEKENLCKMAMPYWVKDWGSC